LLIMFSYDQTLLLVQEAIVLAAFVLFVFRLRSDYGLSLLYLVLGGFQYVQALLILSVYVEIMPHFVVSPGSAVLFTATLFTVLLVYVKEDGIEARKLIFGICIANIALSLLTMMIAGHLRSQDVYNIYNLSSELFSQIPRILVLSTLVLVLDVTCILAIYRALGRWLHRYQLLRIFISMLAASTLDTVLFTTACFVSHDSYRQIFFSALLSKAAATTLYASLLSGYLRIMESDRMNTPLWKSHIASLFSSAQYRNKYEALRREFVRDPLTRVFSRGYFDDAIGRETMRAIRQSETMSIIMLDLDHFKRVNDTFGHQEGDRVLRAIGALLLASVRTYDIPCRYGGEEFFIILPGCDSHDAVRAAEKLRTGLAQLCSRSHPDPRPCEVTATLSVATLPTDTRDCDALISIADQRLYEGKHAGRNRVIAPPQAQQ
jgi:diguanylate cyclase (GGDEF)-like protein